MGLVGDYIIRGIISDPPHPRCGRSVDLCGHKIMALIFFSEKFAGQFLYACAVR